MSPDWQIGEDVYVAPTAVPGFRNMQDPEEENHPDHYSERFIGFEDNGGVHWNSGIPNHAYYLLVNGGLNASCASPGDHNSTHCTGSETPVTGIGLADAEKIAFLGFAGMASYSLTSGSSMADARAATEAAAEALFGSSSQQLQSTSDAWTAVGVSGPQTCNVPDAVIPFQSANPYGNLIDCTWTYNNGSPDFSLHFSVGELELNYDYLYIYDGNDNLLETLTGSFGGHTSVNIPTSAALVRLVTDPFVTGQGFVVDAVVVTGSVSGVVTAAGNPLAGVPVTADTGRWTLTDGGGNYTINDVAPGTRRLCATAPGYQNGGLAGVTVNTGTNTSGVNFALDALPPGEIFFDNFEGETACWTETGLWHQANDSGCTSLPGDSSPDPGYHSPTHSFHYAQDSTCNYSTGVNSGTLTSPVISLAGYKDPSIQFYHWQKVEYWPYFGFDQTFVEVRYAGDQTWTPVWYRDSKTFSAASWEQ